MHNAKSMLDQYFLEMRWRCLTLAADLDRVERSEGGEAALESDPRMQKLHQAMRALLDRGPARAERVLTIFSDLTPPPAR